MHGIFDSLPFSLFLPLSFTSILELVCDGLVEMVWQLHTRRNKTVRPRTTRDRIIGLMVGVGLHEQETIF